MGDFYNGNLMRYISYQLIKNAVITITQEQIIPNNEAKFYFQGTNTVTLPEPLNDSSYIEINILSGSTTITNSIDGVANQVFNTPNTKYLIGRNDTEYFIVSTGTVETSNVMLSTVEYEFDVTNSLKTNLAGGQTNTGVISNVTKYPSISYIAFSDRNLTITIIQYIDSAGTKICDQRTYSCLANVPFSISFPINGNYLQINVKNEDATASTILETNTAYGIIDSTEPIIDDYLRGQGLWTSVINNILTPVAGANGVDVSRYRSFNTQIVSTATGGTFIFEGSNTGATNEWQPIPVYNQALPGRTPIVTAITATASSIMYEGSCTFRFLRLRVVSGLTGGSIQAHTVLLHEPLSTSVQAVGNSTAANLQTTVSGTVTANIGTGSLAAGTNAIGDIGLQVRANATGAPSVTNLNCPATPATQSIKASAGRILSMNLSNTNAAPRYLKVFNVASPTLGTTSAVFEVMIPPNNGIRDIVLPISIGATTAIVVAITGNKGLTDNTAVTLNDVTGFITWA